MAPEITVLMSVRNGLPFVEAAVQSILDQTLRDFEFLILDDASIDGTMEYLRSVRDPRIRIIALESNIGLTAALNRGLREARGALVARQDADDWSHPDRLAKQRTYLNDHPACAVVGAQARLIDERGRSQGVKRFPLSHDGIRFAHLFDNALAHSAVMFRRSVVVHAGGYDEAWTASQDYELWSRLGERGRLANLPGHLVTLRVLENSITRQHKRADLIRRVQTVHFQRLFQVPPNPVDLDLIAMYRSRVVPERLREFRGLLEELVERSENLLPGISLQSDFRRTLALIHERVGYNLLTLERRSAFGELWRALQAWPPSVFTLPWVRIVALGLFGDFARRMHEKLTRGSVAR